MNARNLVKLALCKDGFAHLTLSNPAKHNALSGDVIERIRECVSDIRNWASENDESKRARALFIHSEGKSFCAGADLGWMKAAASYTREENIRDAIKLSNMLKELATLPLPTVALVQGQALGGGVGIVACCDIAAGIQQASFTLSEVKLGLIPATISP